MQDLLKRVNIVQDREMAGRPHRAAGGQEWWDITVKLKNGTSIVADRLNGHGDHYGWKDREAVYGKFKSNAAGVLQPSQIDATINAIMELEKCKDVAEVVSLLTPADDGKR